MTDNERKDAKKAGEFDRRSVLVGSAATAATGALPGAATARSGGGIHIQSAVYMDPKYLDTFNNKRYSESEIAVTCAKIKGLFKTRDDLKWGLYQREIEKNPAMWGTTPAQGLIAYYNWPDFMQDARDNLEKQPAPSGSDPKYATNPFDTSQVEANKLKHFDEVIRIALWDKCVPLKIKVGKKKKRHHGLETAWKISGSKLDLLTINIDCPDGGWQGYTVWPYKAPTAHITGLTASWQVPSPPKHNTGDQVLFIFNGLESSSTKTVPGGILQPVLQWTKAGWAVRSWYVRADFDAVAYPDVPDWSKSKSQADIDKDDKGRCYTKAVSVNPGQTITGTIMGGIDANGKYNYTCSLAVGGINQTDTELRAMDIPELSYPVCAVESYGIRDGYEDEDYPTGSITLTGIGLQIDKYPVNNIQWKESKKAGRDYVPTSSMAGKKIEFKRT